MLFRIQLFVADELQFSTDDTRFSSSETVSLPYLDSLRDLPVFTVEEARRDAFRDLTIVTITSSRISTWLFSHLPGALSRSWAQVNAQGQVFFFRLSAPLSLLQAIGAAGGFRSNDLADKRRVSRDPYPCRTAPKKTSLSMPMN